MWLKKRNGEYVWTLAPGLKTVKPQRNAFKGSLYVLINGHSFSVTSEFASRIHAEKRAVFVGQETGGAYEGDNSGLFVVTQLPNSKIDLGIPTFAFYTANTANKGFYGRGIVPDHIIEPTISDILTKNDAILNYTLQLIQSKSNQTGTATTN